MDLIAGAVRQVDASGARGNRQLGSAFQRQVSLEGSLSAQRRNSRQRQRSRSDEDRSFRKKILHFFPHFLTDQGDGEQ
jgi:hypothetical protein